jgi:hypothetical protein
MPWPSAAAAAAVSVSTAALVRLLLFAVTAGSKGALLATAGHCFSLLVVSRSTGCPEKHERVLLLVPRANCSITFVPCLAAIAFKLKPPRAEKAGSLHAATNGVSKASAKEGLGMNKACWLLSLLQVHVPEASWQLPVGPQLLPAQLPTTVTVTVAVLRRESSFVPAVYVKLSVPTYPGFER